MPKIDLKKELKHLYNPSAKEVVIVDVPRMNFLMIDGVGDPNKAQEFKDAVEALYSVSYALKFMIKKEKKAIDYSVMPLEGLWWVDDMSKFSIEDKDAWKWTVMIMQPEFVTKDLFKKALEQVGKKKNLLALSKMRFEDFHEGLSAQIMHIGPYSAEGPTIKKLHNFIREKGYELRGRHHEIYLGDPRKSAPERMKTIIRQPIEAIKS
ncbi:MAG: GyrI-like domain-containing protein [Nitrososphaerales archaeon]